MPVNGSEPGWTGLKAGFVADWNADGVNDIIAQWKSGTLTVYRGKLSGGFLSPVTAGTAGWQSMNITVGKWHSGHRFPGVVGTAADGAMYFYPNSAGGALGARQQIGHGFQGNEAGHGRFRQRPAPGPAGHHGRRGPHAVQVRRRRQVRAGSRA